jgi:hypothetical protein
MAEETQDHLGRPTATGEPGPQTVTQFAVESGTLEEDAPGVSETIEAEKERAEKGTERAQRVSETMAPDDASPVPPEEGGGQG